MTAPPRVMVLGFDAMDPATVRAMAGTGGLPAFRSLLDTAASARIENPHGFFINNTWTAFFTGWAATRTNWHATDEIAVETYTHRRAPFERLQGAPFWRQADRRVAALDVPHTLAVVPDGGGLEVSEWGSHDRHRGPRLVPHRDGDELLERFGLHPVFGVEPDFESDFAPDDYVHREGHLRTEGEEAALARAMVAGARLKTALSMHVLRRGGWDLFISVAGESHAIGHQQWHLHDPHHPRHDAAMTERIGNPLATVYSHLDRSLAAHLAVAGPMTLVLVVLSHGMGGHYDGSHLLTEVLRRLDSVRGGYVGGFLGSPQRRYASDADRRRQRFFRSPNNDHIGAIRLNLIGREPAGIIDPGEAGDVMDWLSSELMELVNADTGAPAVRAVERVADHHGRFEGDTFPDLFVQWNHEAEINTLSSPRIGVVHLPGDSWRTGDHRPHGLLLATGPGIRGPATMPPVAMLDLAPTILAALGARVDTVDLDGTPIPWLAARASVGAA